MRSWLKILSLPCVLCAVWVGNFLWGERIKDFFLIRKIVGIPNVQQIADFHSYEGYRTLDVELKNRGYLGLVAIGTNLVENPAGIGTTRIGNIAIDCRFYRGSVSVKSRGAFDLMEYAAASGIIIKNLPDAVRLYDDLYALVRQKLVIERQVVTVPAYSPEIDSPIECRGSLLTVPPT